MDDATSRTDTPVPLARESPGLRRKVNVSASFPRQCLRPGQRILVELPMLVFKTSPIIPRTTQPPIPSTQPCRCIRYQTGAGRGGEASDQLVRVLRGERFEKDPW
jgi:hypothetical protein